jgi:hypothetical protein
MTHLQLSDEEALVLHEVLEARWQELLKEIRHTDHREFRDHLKARATLLERLLQQLPSQATGPR